MVKEYILNSLLVIVVTLSMVTLFVEALVIISSKLSSGVVYINKSVGNFLVRLSFHLTFISLSSRSITFLQELR